MTNIREEYKKQKILEQEMISEAAMKWLESNVVLITERINRKAVQDLIAKINKFETRFGPFRNKLSSVSKILNSTEDALILVLTGKTSDKRAGDMLKQMTFTYNLLSSFFAKDLPLIMQTPIFNVPRENPDLRINSMSLNYKPDLIRASLLKAIQPSRDEEKLYKKILNSTKLPHIENATIVDELMNLSYNDLLELTKIERVPVAVPMAAQTPEQPQQQQMESVNPGMVTEAIDVRKLKFLTDKISTLTKVIKPFASEMPETMRALNEAARLLIQAQNPSLLKKGLDAIKKTIGADAESQIMNLYSMFFNLKQAWPHMKSAIDNLLKTSSQDTEDDMASFQEKQKDYKAIQAMIEKAISPGLIAGSKSLSLLGPKQFASELMALATDENDEIFIQPVDDVVSKIQNFSSPKQIINNTQTVGTKQTKSTANQNIQSTKPTASATKPSAPTRTTDDTDAVTTAPSGNKTASTEAITDEIMTVLGRGRDPGAKKLVSGVIDTLKQQGYQISK